MRTRKPKMAKGMPKMPMGGKMGRGQFKGAKVNERPMRAGKPDGTKGKRGSSDMAMLQERMPR